MKNGISLKFLQSILSDFIHDFSSAATSVTMGLDLLNIDSSDLNKKQDYIEIISSSAKKLKHCIEFYKSSYNLDQYYIEKSTKQYLSHFGTQVEFEKIDNNAEFKTILVFILIWLSKKAKPQSKLTIGKYIEAYQIKINDKEKSLITKNSPYYFHRYNGVFDSPILELATKYAKELNYDIYMEEINEKVYIKIKKLITM